MPGRVNTKFVLILLISISAIAVVLVGVYWFQFRSNPEILARKGDVFMQQQEYSRAIDSYRRAAMRSNNDLKYWDKLIDALRIAPVEFQVNAENNFRILISTMRQKADIAVTDPEIQHEYYQFLCDLSEELGYPWLYQQLYTDTNSRLDSQPDLAVAHKYRGIARVHLLTDRGDQFDRPRAEIDTARTDLLAALDRWPDDADTLYYLAQWKLFEARFIRNANGKLEEYQGSRNEALSLSKRMLDLDPADPQLALRHARICLAAGEDMKRDARPDAARTQALHDEAAQLITQVEKTLTDGDLKDHGALKLVLNTAQLLQLVDNELMALPDTENATTRGRYRAMQLLESALQKQPDTVDYLVQRGILLMSMGKTDEALASFEEARRPGRAQPAVEMLRTQSQQVLAAIQTGNILVSRIAAAQDDTEKQQFTDRVMALIKELEPVYGRIPALDLLEGKLKLTQNDMPAALQLFDKAARATSETDPESMHLAAVVARQLGDWGDAARRLKIILAANPENLQSRLELTEIYLTGGQMEDARVQLDILAKVAPDNPVAQMLQANYLAMSGDLDKAIAVYEAQDASANPNVDLILARLYLLAKRPEDARPLIERRFQQNPTDMQTLTALLRLTDDEQQQQAYLKQAEDAGVEANVLKLVTRQLSPEPITTEELETLLPQVENDPFRLALTQARRLILEGKLDEADKQLAEAAALKPDDKTLVELRFSLALRRQDWELAQRLADRAKATNLDLAGGAFFRAQLAAEQGKLQDAAAEYESALNNRPIFSNGWRMLGDVYAQLNRVQSAIDAYRHALDQQPNDATTLDHLSRVEVQAQLTSQALTHARDAWRYAPNNRDLLERYIEMERAFGDPAAALKLRQQLAQSQPDNADNQRSLIRLMHDQGQRDEARAQLEQLIAAEGLNRPNAATKAELLLREGKSVEGEKVLTDFIASLGDKAESADHAMLAQYRLRVGNIAGGIDAYNAARSLDTSDNMVFTRMLGDELFARNVYDKAADLYRQVLAKTPDDLTVQLRLGETLLRMGEFDEMRKLLKNVEPTAPEDRSTLYVLQSVLALPPDKDPEAPENHDAKVEALRLVNLAIQQNESNPTAYTRRASLLMNDPQRIASAIADLNKALEINARLDDARAMLVQVYLKQNNIEDATRELRQIVEANPLNRQARLMLINLSQQNGDGLTARRLADDAIALQPDDPFWAGVRARLALNAGDQGEALRQFKRQMDLDANPATVGQYVQQLLRGNQNQAALDTLQQQAGVVNQDLNLQTLRARATYAAGQTDSGAQLFVNTINRARSMGDVASISGQMTAVMTPQQASGLLGRATDIQQPAWLQIAEANLLVRDRQFEEAISRLEPLHGQLADDEQTYRIYLQELAQAYQLARKPEQARAAYDELVKLAPNDASVLNNLAYLLLEDLDNPTEALAMAKRAADALPDNAAVLDTLGWAQYKAGKLDEARRTLENSVARQPLAASCIHLAQVYIDLGLGSRSHDLLNRAIELADESEDKESRDTAQSMLDSLAAESAQ